MTAAAIRRRGKRRVGRLDRAALAVCLSPDEAFKLRLTAARTGQSVFAFLQLLAEALPGVLALRTNEVPHDGRHRGCGVGPTVARRGAGCRGLS